MLRVGPQAMLWKGQLERSQLCVLSCPGFQCLLCENSLII